MRKFWNGLADFIFFLMKKLRNIGVYTRTTGISQVRFWDRTLGSKSVFKTDLENDETYFLIRQLF